MENLVHGVRHLRFLPGRNTFVGLGDDGLVVELRGRKGEGVTSAQGKGLKIPYKLRKNRGSQGEAFPGLKPASGSKLMIQNFYIQPRPPDSPCPSPGDGPGCVWRCKGARVLSHPLLSRSSDLGKWAQSSLSSSKHGIYPSFPLYFQNPFKSRQLCLWNIF